MDNADVLFFETVVEFVASGFFTQPSIEWQGDEVDGMAICTCACLLLRRFRYTLLLEQIDLLWGC